jgi:excinuclease ABC subunit B
MKETILILSQILDKIDRLLIAPASIEPDFKSIKNYKLFPGNFWPTFEEKLPIAIENINLELQNQLQELKNQNKLLEAQRLEQRTNNDMDMLLEAGFCQGIENYSRHLEFREPGKAPHSLVDYFPEDYLLIIDESHQTLPQLRAMAVQDKVRKQVLIEHGFRLPSAIDNRPLRHEELEERINQVVYVSATPGRDERQKVKKENVVEQLIRPTGLLEPSIEVRPTENQVKDLIKEIKKRSKRKERVLAITLTKRLSEALAEYLSEEGISAQYIHSEIKTMERPKILTDLREGKYDVLIGINLLREGLDLPEVALVAILDADKEGFLRSETTLIQTMGRTARHVKGHVILYADYITKSMQGAIGEVTRRRNIQNKYNKKHDVTPKPITKEIRYWPFVTKEKEVDAEFWMIKDKKLLEKEMKQAAKDLDFERAAKIRDIIQNLNEQKPGA